MRNFSLGIIFSLLPNFPFYLLYLLLAENNACLESEIKIQKRFNQWNSSNLYGLQKTLEERYFCSWSQCLWSQIMILWKQQARVDDSFTNCLWQINNSWMKFSLTKSLPPLKFQDKKLTLFHNTFYLSISVSEKENKKNITTQIYSYYCHI